MNFTTELIVLSIVIILLFIRPNALVKFSKSTIGKVVFVSIIILSSSMNPLIGLCFATLMVLLLETSYEGFKEGLGFANPNAGYPAAITSFGVTDSNVDSIILADSVSNFADLSVNKVDLSGSGLASLTLITDQVDTSSIIIQPLTVTGGKFPNLEDISFVRVESTEIANYIHTPLTGTGGVTSYDISFIYSTNPYGNPPTAIITTPTSGLGSISKIVDMTGTGTRDEYTIESQSTIPKIHVITGDYSRKLTHKSVDSAKLYLSFDAGNDPIVTNDYVVDPGSSDNEVYKVNDVSNTFIATLGTATMSSIPHNTSLQIHDHKHDFTYTGTDPHTHETFTSYNRGDETIQDVKPYQEPEITFLSDLTGETVCSTNLCDRIDAETKIIFPIFSNNHCPTNI